ncbi:16S rRNA (guanine(966)-N(2))-methyltransferase RsmD [Dissulfurispira sp.]|uniref:16S rRNA (guanine(966)-N(2))-methyltransferase RsmD n=1 Tax=Dissulfurispira sp. TaxID=2817609 RepID=UPI002FD97B9E
MRISGGIAKGRKVGLRKAFVKKGEAGELRPTSAKVRQAIFNILGDRIIDAAFLDLYAGTGAVGIEALSRGAGKVFFVDDNSLRISIIKELIEKFGFKDRAKVVKDRASNFIKKSESVFDIIFVDPPYASGELDIILPLIDERSILGDNGVVIAEHSSKKKLISEIGILRLIKTYKYGDTSLTLYRKEEKVEVKEKHRKTD